MDEVVNKPVNQSQLDFTMDGGVICLSGELDRFTVATLDKKVRLKRISDEKLVIDLANVSKVDSAGLAWILKAKATADQAGQLFSLNQAPQQLLVLAKLSGIESLIGTQSLS